MLVGKNPSEEVAKKEFFDKRSKEAGVKTVHIDADAIAGKGVVSLDDAVAMSEEAKKKAAFGALQKAPSLPNQDYGMQLAKVTMSVLDLHHDVTDIGNVLVKIKEESLVVKQNAKTVMDLLNKMNVDWSTRYNSLNAEWSTRLAELEEVLAKLVAEKEQYEKENPQHRVAVL